MKNRGRGYRWCIALLATALVASLWSGDASHTPAPLVDRIWLDHVPQSEKDKINLFVMISDPQVGGFVYTSQFEGDWAAFSWKLERSLEISMLQSGNTHHLGARVTHPCGHFDYCLDLEGAPRGARRYVSMKEWVIDSEQSLDASALAARAWSVVAAGDSDR